MPETEHNLVLRRGWTPGTHGANLFYPSLCGMPLGAAELPPSSCGEGCVGYFLGIVQAYERTRADQQWAPLTL